MTLVVLIADGGPDAGLGHLSRCSALAVALRQQGASVRTLGLDLRAPLDRYGVWWEPVAQPYAADADAIVLDSYKSTAELRASLASNAPVVAFADEDGEVPGAALVVRSGAGSGREGELTGLAYACLGPEYWYVLPRPIRQEVELVLVATGAGDHSGIGPRLARELKSALPGADVVLVRGPHAPPIDVPQGVRTVWGLYTLFNVLVDTDMVVCAAGQTMLEALALGTPCVALVTAENQRRQAVELRDAGAAVLAESVEQAAAAAGAIAADFEARCRQADAGRRAVDGQGAMRVAAEVLGLAASRRPHHESRPSLELRPAGLDDAGFLLALRNNPDTRRFSFTHYEISEHEHIAWFTKRLSDPASFIWIAIADGRPCGQLRLTRLDDDAAEVHIAVAPAYRGRGVAREMLASAVDLCAESWPQVARLRARIMLENNASLQAFRAAGFQAGERSDQRGEHVLERVVTTRGRSTAAQPAQHRRAPT